MSSEPVLAEGLETLLADSAPQSALDRKIVEHFSGYVVRKDLTNGLKQNAVVPTYVLEYLLGQHCATDDPTVIRSGLESVRRILARHYVHRNEAELVKSTIKERGRHKVIDKLTVELNEKGGFYEAEFTNLGIKKVPISDDFVRRFPKLLVGGIWTITDVAYEVAGDPRASPWQIEALKPIQVPGVNLDEYLQARAQFTTEEWMDALMQSIGFNPEMFDRRAKLLVLIRLVPYCERNYNLLELGPKGTGKSHIYAEFSPHGMLISGSEVTTPKLFVNNASGKIGLVGYWDCICFDEFAGKDKRVDKALVDIMKNYMANRTFSRGIEQLSAEASMVFMGNTQKSVAYMLKHSHFFEPLPDKYIDSAFLDRIHAFNPGWEVAPIRHELFTRGYGFIVDFLAEVLKQLRTEDFTGAYKPHFEIVSEVSTRDQTGFEKTFSGMMKILYPDGNATPPEIEELLSFAMESRRRVREHILRIDDTFKRHDFIYRPTSGGAAVTVLTREEIQYPTDGDASGDPGALPAPATPLPAPDPEELAATTGSSNREYGVGDLIHERFEVRAMLGSGGFSRVFRVYDPIEEEERALKLFHSVAGYSAVRREISVLRRIQHPHVVKVIWAARTQHGEWYLISEYVRGEPLQHYARGTHPLPDGEAVDAALNVLDALIEIHPDTKRLDELEAKKRGGAFSMEDFQEMQELQASGFVHRDIKPQNIILTLRGAKVLDFNIASRVGDQVKTVSGTPPYQAPDPDYTRWDVSTDLFAVGVTLYELLCHGEHPYPNRKPMVGEPVRDPKQIRPDLDDRLAAFLRRACASYRDERFQTAVQMHDELQAVRAEM